MVWFVEYVVFLLSACSAVSDREINVYPQWSFVNTKY